MSYAFNRPCFNCKKQDSCDDQTKIREAVDKIHKDSDTHLGAGELVLMCVRLESKS